MEGTQYRRCVIPYPHFIIWDGKRAHSQSSRELTVCNERSSAFACSDPAGLSSGGMRVKPLHPVALVMGIAC